jgi:hypothetical protein
MKGNVYLQQTKLGEPRQPQSKDLGQIGPSPSVDCVLFSQSRLTVLKALSTLTEGICL